MEKMEKNGYTLLEIAVSMSIFAIMLSVTMAAFVKGFHSQARVVNMQSVQRESAYLMEVMSREIRTGSSIGNVYSGQGPISDISLGNHDGTGNVRFCRANADGGCSSSGEYFSMDGSIMNASDVRVSRLEFYVSDFAASGYQPLITMVVELQSKKDSTVKMSLQSSVAMRLY